MNYASDYADPEAAARKLVEIAASIEPVQDGRIHIEKINAPFLFAHKAEGSEFCRRPRVRDRARLERHESGTFVRLKKPSEDLMLRWRQLAVAFLI